MVGTKAERAREGGLSGGLAAIRRAIADKPERWLTTEAALCKAGLDLTRGNALARLPKGFEGFAGQPLAQVLKLRNFVVSRPIPKDRLYGAGLVDEVVSFAISGLPLLEFGWRALT